MKVRCPECGRLGDLYERANGTALIAHRWEGRGRELGLVDSCESDVPAADLMDECTADAGGES